MHLIMVTGATGTISSTLIPLLAKAGLPVRAMTRSRDKVAGLRELGAEAVVGDFRSSESLRTAFDGVTELFLLTPPHEQAVEWGQAAIAIAKEARVRRIVRISAIKAASDGPSDNSRQHARADQELRASGLPHVILRPHYFMQNLLLNLNSLECGAPLPVATGQARLAMIDARDIADVAAKTLADDRWDGGTYDLTGPEAVTFAEVASHLSRVLGRNVQCAATTPRELGHSIRRAGMGDWAARTYQDYLQAYAEGWGNFTTDWVQSISGHRARTFGAFCDEVVRPRASGRADSDIARAR